VTSDEFAPCTLEVISCLSPLGGLCYAAFNESVGCNSAGSCLLQHAQLMISESILVEPLVFGPTCFISIWNPVLSGHARTGRFDRVILSAHDMLRGMPSYHTVRVRCGVGPNCRLAVGRCLCFLRDDQGKVFVCLQWFDDFGQAVPEDPSTRLCLLKLLPITEYDSYDIISVEDIISGALVLPSTNAQNSSDYYLVQTPREQNEHNRRCLTAHLLHL
jgi:hypothetical protein